MDHGPKKEVGKEEANFLLENILRVLKAKSFGKKKSGKMKGRPFFALDTTRPIVEEINFGEVGGEFSAE